MGAERSRLRDQASRRGLARARRACEQKHSVDHGVDAKPAPGLTGIGHARLGAPPRARRLLEKGWTAGRPRAAPDQPPSWDAAGPPPRRSQRSAYATSETRYPPKQGAARAGRNARHQMRAGLAPRAWIRRDAAVWSPFDLERATSLSSWGRKCGSGGFEWRRRDIGQAAAPYLTVSRLSIGAGTLSRECASS